MTLHKYAYGNLDPVNMIDPSGNFGLASFGVSSNINAILTTASVASSGFNLYSAATDEDGITAKEIGFSILIAAAGPAGGKLIGILAKTKKAQKLLSALENASENAYKAAKNIKQWVPKNKHMLSTTSKTKARFNTNSEDQVRKWVTEALRTPRAQFIPEPGKTDRFRMIVDMGQEIGVKGQRKIRVIVGKDGSVINAFPVHTK